MVPYLKHRDGKDILLGVSDLKNIIQFEIEKPFQDFAPHFHYEVVPE